MKSRTRTKAAAPKRRTHTRDRTGDSAATIRVSRAVEMPPIWTEAVRGCRRLEGAIGGLVHLAVGGDEAAVRLIGLRRRATLGEGTSHSFSDTERE